MEEHGWDIDDSVWGSEEGKYLWMLAIMLRDNSYTKKTLGPRFRHLIKNYAEILGPVTDAEIWWRATHTDRDYLFTPNFWIQKLVDTWSMANRSGLSSQSARSSSLMKIFNGRGMALYISQSDFEKSTHTKN